MKNILNKKIVGILIALLLCGISCKKDNTKPAEPENTVIIGDWVYQSLTADKDILWEDGSYGKDGLANQKDCEQDDFFRFIEKGVFQKHGGDFKCIPNVKEITQSVWRINGDTIVLGNEGFNLIHIDSSTLKFKSYSAPVITYEMKRRNTDIDLSNVGQIQDVTFTYQGKLVTLKTVKAKDGKIWLQQNLGSARVATNVYDTTALGHFFQWGRWDDGHQLPDSKAMFSGFIAANPLDIKNGDANYYKDWWEEGDENSRWTAARPSDVSDTNGCDPCKAIGAGWRMPRDDEWQKVLAAENITSLSSGFSSNLKLSAGKARSYDGQYGVFAYGHYWTATANLFAGTGSTSLDARANGIDLTDGKASVNPYFFRANAMSVRCIKDIK